MTPRLILALNRILIVQIREHGRHNVGPGDRRRLQHLRMLTRSGRVSRRGRTYLGE